MLWLPGDWLDQSADMLAAGAADGRALVRAQGERLRLAGRLLSSSWGTVGDFLGPSIEHFYAVHPQAKLERYWRAAGLQAITVRHMSLGGGTVMTATKSARSERRPPPSTMKSVAAPLPHRRRRRR